MLLQPHNNLQHHNLANLAQAMNLLKDLLLYTETVFCLGKIDSYLMVQKKPLSYFNQLNQGNLK